MAQKFNLGFNGSPHIFPLDSGRFRVCFLYGVTRLGCFTFASILTPHIIGPDMSKRWPIGVTCMKLSLRARNSCSSFGVVLILSILDGGEYVRTKMTGTALKNPFGKNFGRCADSHNVVNLEHGRILTFEEATRICTTASTICLLLPHGRSKKIA